MRTTDRDRIRTILETDRAWAVYALGDLDPGLFEDCEWFHRPGEPPALALLYRGFDTPVLFTIGAADAVRALLDEIGAEPTMYLSVRPEVVSVIKERYTVRDAMPMWRMILDQKALAAPDAGRARRLGLADHAELERLYADGSETGEAPGFFTAEMPERGVYFGIEEGGEGLVATAGTHLVCPSESVAAIGNVYTRRDRRGQGLGTCTTGAVARGLVCMGIRTIALNVARANLPALRAYEKVGFRKFCAFYEGIATLKGSSCRPQWRTST